MITSYVTRHCVCIMWFFLCIYIVKVNGTHMRLLKWQFWEEKQVDIYLWATKLNMSFLGLFKYGFVVSFV